MTQKEDGEEKLHKAITTAVKKAVKEVGLETIREMSMFPSSSYYKKKELKPNHDEHGFDSMGCL